MNEEIWITYERPSRTRRGVKQSVTRLESEPKATNFPTFRYATPDEIAAEKTRRAEAQASAEMFAAFKARPEYADAQAIAAEIEYMTPSDNPLDRLTAKEWADLRKKIKGIE